MFLVTKRIASAITFDPNNRASICCKPMQFKTNPRFPGLSHLQDNCDTIGPRMQVRPARALSSCIFPILVLACPLAACAQLFQGRLGEVVLLTLLHEPNIASANCQIVLSESRLQTVRGKFDTESGANVASRKSCVPLITALQAPARDQVNASTTSRSAGSTTRGRPGMPPAALRVDRRRDGPNEASRPASSQLAVDLALPLLRGQGADTNSPVERAAWENLHATQFAYRHTVALRIAASVDVYWDYLAATRALEIRVQSEARSLLLLEDARRLAKGDEIPQADVLQNEAQLARDRGLRLAAEQSVMEARGKLAIAMGLPVGDLAQLAAPLDDFPDPQPAEVARLQSLPPMSPPAGRFDLQAAHRCLSAAEILYEAVRKDPVLRIDLAASVGCNWLVENRPALAAAEALGRPPPGFNASLGLVHVIPVQGNAQAGLVRQRAALADQARIELDALLLAVRVGIAVQRSNLSSAILQLEQQQRQLMLQTQVFANERKKYRLGLATVLDLLTVEARLTSDELTVIDARRRLAQALVGYRFETGTLLDADTDGESGQIDLQSLTTLPEIR